MSAHDKFEKNGLSEKTAQEIRLNARAVSRGVAVGRAVCLHGSNRQFYRIDIAEAAIADELKRFRGAIAAAKKKLSRLAGKKKGVIARSGPGIFAAHFELMDDPSFAAKIEAEIASQRVNAEWAIKSVTDEYVARYKAISDEHFRDRYIDIEDVSDRILSALGAKDDLKLPFGEDSIVVAEELKPSTLVEISGHHPRGFVTENGGWTSHSFILAREMRRPAVPGVNKVFRQIRTGDLVIVDGFNGEVILNPGPRALEHFSKTKRPKELDQAETFSAEIPIATLDGRKIRIYANADDPDAYARAREFGAEGIGLFRSEFLFGRFREMPSEDEQAEAYINAANAAGEAGVKIRTFDINADRLADENFSREPNPALGLRGVRLGLSHKTSLRTQLRAILRASAEGPVDLILPLVSGISEIRAVRKILAAESKSLRSKGIAAGSPKLGVMIEVPSAVLMADEMAAEADFLCLGTNDLIQYILAADRDNEAVSGWYRSLHPAVIKAVKTVIEAAKNAGGAAIICGEMAGSPYYVPLLLGLGATELSMNPTSIPPVRKMIAGIAAEEAEMLVKSISDARTVDQVESRVDKHIRKNWLHLFPEDFSFH